MEVILPDLRLWQKDVFDDIIESLGTGKVFTVKARRQCGKSLMCQIILIAISLKKKGLSAMIEPTNAQCRSQYNDMKDMLQDTGLVKNFHNQAYEIEFINGSVVMFKSAEVRERLRGYSINNILIIDEAAYIRDEIMQVAFPWCDASKAPMLLVSTPLFQDGIFYKFFANPDNVLSFSYDWIRYDTSEFLSADKMEFYRQQMSPIKFKSEILGEFITDGSYVFKNIIASIRENNNQPVYCGIDWGSGNSGDYTAITMLDEECNIVDVHYFNDKDAVAQIDYIADLINRTTTLKLVQVELNSIGRVFYDNLKQKLVKKSILKGFNTTNDSKRDIIETLAAAFENQTVHIINHTELIKELQHYALEKTPTGKITYNGINGIHDDLVMSFAIAYNCKNKKSKYSIKVK